MKRYLVMLAACSLLASCELYYKNFASIEDCAKWYCEEIYDEVKEGDVEDVREVMFDLYEWMDSLEPFEEDRAYEAVESWQERYEFKNEVIDDFCDIYDDLLP